MNKRSFFRQFTFLVLFSFLFVNFSFAQNQPVPRQEKLLNGLNLLIWNNPGADKAVVKLRIHSGSAFDPQNKEGVMALLADILFPNENINEFFAEELGGSLSIESNYDYIQINATGDNDKVLTILETIATAVTNPQIDKETTAKVLQARLEKVKELEKNPAYIADVSARQRLLGTFPYGRAQSGTPESLAKIDFADLIFARERFLTADNATLAVSGNVKPDLIYRAVRRYFGAWRKSEQRIPATFAQPDAPDPKLQLIASEDGSVNEARFAFRGLARNDKDFAASQVLIKIAENRLQKEIPAGKKAFIRHESNMLPGLVLVGLSNLIVDVQGQLSDKPPITHQFSIKEENLAPMLFFEKITLEEFEKAKAQVLRETNQADQMDFWLDVDTYKLGSVKDEIQKINNIVLADVQRVAETFQKRPAVKIWVVKSPAEKKTEN